MNYQPRYEAFLKMGGGTNIEFMMFISRMKRKYLEANSLCKEDRIKNHDAFTAFIFSFVDEWLSSGETIKEFLNGE